MAPDIAPGWAHPYPPGPFSPVFYADGDPVAEPDTEPEPEPEPEPDVDPVDVWTPPTKEEWEAHTAKLKTASGEAAVRRKFLKQHGIDLKTGKKVAPDDDPEPQPDPVDDKQPQGLSEADMKRQIQRAVAEAKIEGMRGAKKLATGFFSALNEAGWNGTRLDLIMPLSDLEDADPDDDEDLAERVEHVKKLYPEGFQPTKRARNPANPSNGAGGSGQNGVPAAKVDAADKKPPAPEPKDWVEKLARQATRGA